MEEISNVVENGVFCIYDCKLHSFELPIILPVNTAIRDVKQIVNSYGSKYFFTPTDFILYRLGNYDVQTGRFDLLDTKDYIELGRLNDFVDETLRRRFMLMHTLNTLPVGYYKMPQEMKEDIQKNIDECCKLYVSEFIVPEIEAGNMQINSNIQNPPSETEREVH